MYYLNIICVYFAVAGALSIKAESVYPVNPPEIQSNELEMGNYLRLFIANPGLFTATEDQGIMLREYAFVAASRFIHNSRSGVPEYAVLALLPVDTSTAIHIAEIRLLSLWPITERQVENETWITLSYCLRLISEHPSESSLRVVFVLLQRYRIPKLSVQLYEVAEKLIDGIEKGSYYHNVLAQYKPVEGAAAVVRDPDLIDLDEDAMKQAHEEILKGIARWIGGLGPVAGHRTVDLGNGVSLELVWIPPGTFAMGSPLSERGRGDNEGPQHWVTISQGFWMGKYPVTQQQWRQLMGTARRPHFSDEDATAPMERVSWNDAKEFCGKLQERLGGDLRGLRVRLPTEAEWEYACRAGTTAALYTGRELTSTGGSCRNLDEIAWYDENSGGTTRPVGRKQPNEWGLYDMLGNVWEWCEDGERDYTSAVQTDPVGSGTSRVLRGGSWYCFAWFCRSAFRLSLAPGIRSNSNGFRVVVVR